MSASVTRHGDHLMIKLPLEDVHSLRVALQPCSCRETKSNATSNIRTNLAKAMSKALYSNAERERARAEQEEKRRLAENAA